MRAFLWIVLLALLQAAPGVSQSSGPQVSASQKPPLSWASVSIHVSNPNEGNTDSRDQADGITEHNMSLREIISQGYNFNVLPFREEEILGLPEWARNERYDVLARVDADDVDAFKKISNLSMKETLAAFASRQPTGEMLMMQTLLQDRFALRVHWDVKKQNAFALVLAKGGLRLKPSSADPEHGELGFSPGHLSGKGVPLSFLASILAMPVGHTVFDTTGITGVYDFDLHFAPQDNPASTPSNDPDIYTAVQEQLGLKLESRRASLPVLVVDHIERPTPN